MEQKKVDFVVVNDEKDGNLELGNNKGVYTSDSLKQYLNEISQFSPLTKKRAT